MAIETMRGTSMTDQTKAVAALAEAMANCWGGIANDLTRINARYALQAILANPDILREYGIGRLPTRSELESIWGDDAFVGVRISEMIRLGWATEDPDPQPPEPTLREQLSGVMRETVDSLPWPTPLDKDMYGMVSDRLIAEFDITPKAPRP